MKFSFNVFTKHFFTNAVSPIDTGESLHLPLVTISGKDHMILVILIYLFDGGISKSYSDIDKMH
jgi:hypothetical protein